MTVESNSHDVEIEHLDPQPVLSIRQTVRVADLGQAMGERIPALWGYMQQQGVRPAGPLYVRYHTFGDTETDMETGLPVVEAVAGEGQINSGELPGGPAVTTWHFGAHHTLGEAYQSIGTWLETSGRAPDGPSWEVYYWIDPSQNPNPDSWNADPSTWRIQLIQPIK